MYAVIRSGGKQYTVRSGNIVRLELIRGEVGDPVVFNDILAVVSDEVHVGRPCVKDATVQGTIVAQEKAKKIIVFKKKRRKGYRRTMGHRQLLTRCRIDEIRLGPPVEQGNDARVEETSPTASPTDNLQET